MAIYVDPSLSADDLRTELYAGHLVVMTRLSAVHDLVEHTRSSLEALFSPHNPKHAHEHLTPGELAPMLASWKPLFIHDKRSKELVRAVIMQAGFAPTLTHFEVPKPRTSFPQGHLNAGAAFGFPWHRDVWYGAPAQQVNWWLPVFPVRADNSMGFDPASFARPVSNDSHLFDYYENNGARRTSAAQVNREVQVRPQALDHRVEDELVILLPPGAVMLFSGAQLHRTIPNSSGLARFSVDFRTVDARDLRNGRGGPIVDAQCSGTAIRDFRNLADDSMFEERMIVELFGAPPPDAMLVFGPKDAAGGPVRS